MYFSDTEDFEHFEHYGGADKSEETRRNRSLDSALNTGSGSPSVTSYEQMHSEEDKQLSQSETGSSETRDNFEKSLFTQLSENDLLIRRYFNFKHNFNLKISNYNIINEEKYGFKKGDEIIFVRTIDDNGELNSTFYHTNELKKKNKKSINIKDHFNYALPAVCSVIIYAKRHIKDDEKREEVKEVEDVELEKTILKYYTFRLYKSYFSKGILTHKKLIEILQNKKFYNDEIKIKEINTFNLNSNDPKRLTVTLDGITELNRRISLTCELEHTMSMRGSPLQNNLVKIVVALRSMGSITDTLFDHPDLSGILYKRDGWSSLDRDMTRYDKYCRNEQNNYYITSFNKTRLGFWEETINALNEIKDYDLKFYVCNKNNKDIAQYLQYCGDFSILGSSDWKQMKTSINIDNLNLKQLTPDLISKLKLNKIYTLYPPPQ